jgi:hypothetical protein
MTNQCKLFIGCVSRNTIDATIEYANEHDILLGLIPSRRQIDYDGGYIGFTSHNLYNYVHSKTKNVILQRDHGGPSQGKKIDDGVVSIIDDCKYYNLLHIDPWKQYPDIEEGLYYTKNLIDLCLSNNFKGKFEISTEQSIRNFNVSEVEYITKFLLKYPIKYVVIQSGTSLKENINTGLYDQSKLINFCSMVKKYGYLSKEHNGDYMDSNLIKEKFRYGLDAINIAPEFGYYESTSYISAIKKFNPTLLKILYQICYDSNQWKKWVDKNFDINNQEKLIEICGHYILETPLFIDNIKNKLPDISDIIKNKIKTKFYSIHN